MFSDMPTAVQKQRVREAKAAMYRQIVIEAAERVFGEAGYAGARMQDIAREAGISLGTVYALYEGKVDVWRAVHDKHLSQLFAGVSEPMGRLQAEGAGVLDMLLAGIAAYVIQERTRVGRWVYALGSDEEIAEQSGVPVAWTRIAVFTIAGVFFGLGGALAAAQLG